MIPAKRQRLILDLVNKAEMVSIEELCSMLDVSHMTIRRDLKVLDDQDKIVLVSGGAKALVTPNLCPTIDKTPGEVEFSNSIKRLTALIKPNTGVFIDSGCAGLLLAKEICKNRELCDHIFVVSNNIPALCYLLANSKNRLYVIGGEIQEGNDLITVQNYIDHIMKINIDIAFFESKSLDKRFLYTNFKYKNDLYESISGISNKIIVFSKKKYFGVEGIFRSVRISDIYGVYFEDDICDDLKINIMELGVKLL